MRNFAKSDFQTDLSPEEYKQLRLTILQRNSWRCQSCGTSTNLEVHHLVLRSHSRRDCEDNLITLCHPCHQALHGREGL